MAWLLEQGLTPDVIPNGAKVMSIRHSTLSISVIDSINFLPMSLSKLPSCFGLTELKKGYFPHLFNRRENQAYVGPFPESSFFCPDTMSSKAKSEFFVWYEQNKDKEFDFQKEMLEYCRSDVDILRRSCSIFREEMIRISGVDPFCYITIASTCMAVYRSRHLQSGTIAMVPVNGYINCTNYSSDAIRWLDFVASDQDITIEHALNGSGEIKIGGVSVDGFCRQTNTIYQFHGCFYHGCPDCYEGDTIHPFKKCPMSTLLAKTKETSDKFRSSGYEIIMKFRKDSTLGIPFSVEGRMP
nr:uncharacterized protein LOC122269882 [Parasteatoda tepidariorum]